MGRNGEAILSDPTRLLHPPCSFPHPPSSSSSPPILPALALTRIRGLKSPRREVVRSSAGAGVVYPPFLGSFA